MSEVVAMNRGADPRLSPDDLRTLSDEEIAKQIATWAGRIAAGEARLLALVGEFDAREAWGGSSG
jgi:hypothetical protein